MEVFVVATTQRWNIQFKSCFFFFFFGGPGKNDKKWIIKISPTQKSYHLAMLRISCIKRELLTVSEPWCLNPNWYVSLIFSGKIHGAESPNNPVWPTTRQRNLKDNLGLWPKMPGLRKVIMSLAKQSRTDRQFMVPYRESKWFGCRTLVMTHMTNTLIHYGFFRVFCWRWTQFKHKVDLTTFCFSFWHDQNLPVSESISIGFKKNLRLTILLRDAIGGSGYTLMLACLSMLDSNFEENLSTLQYATWMNLLATFFGEKNMESGREHDVLGDIYSFAVLVWGRYTTAMEFPAWNF